MLTRLGIYGCIFYRCILFIFQKLIFTFHLLNLHYLKWWNDNICTYHHQIGQMNHHTFLMIRSLTHWGRMTHICVSKLTIIGSDNGLSPERRQAIIWTNAGILLIGPLEPNFSEISIEIQTFSLKKTRLKMSSAKCCSFRLGLNLLNNNVCWMSCCILIKGINGLGNIVT